MSNPILVEVTRGPLVESVHRGSIAVCDAAGKIVFSLGDLETPIYPRSSLKPIQTLPLIESGAAEGSAPEQGGDAPARRRRRRGGRGRGTGGEQGVAEAS